MSFEKYYEEFFNELRSLGNDADVYDTDVQSYYDLKVDVEEAAEDFYYKNLE